MEHEYKDEEEEHVNDPEDGHAVARDPDHEEHDHDHVDPVARAGGPQPRAQRRQQPRAPLLLPPFCICSCVWDALFYPQVSTGA